MKPTPPPAPQPPRFHALNPPPRRWDDEETFRRLGLKAKGQSIVRPFPVCGEIYEENK